MTSSGIEILVWLGNILGLIKTITVIVLFCTFTLTVAKVGDYFDVKTKVLKKKLEEE